MSSCVHEVRFRIDPGVRGLYQLFRISEFLNNNFHFNSLSGIHYHIDCTRSIMIEKYGSKTVVKNVFDILLNFHEQSHRDERFLFYENSILKRLDNWNYSGGFNSRYVSMSKEWVKLHSTYRTVEIRIGEMTFDYQLLLRRIYDCCRIVRRWQNHAVEYYVKETF